MRFAVYKLNMRVNCIKNITRLSASIEIQKHLRTYKLIRTKRNDSSKRKLKQACFSNISNNQTEFGTSQTAHLIQSPTFLNSTVLIKSLNFLLMNINFALPPAPPSSSIGFGSDDVVCGFHLVSFLSFCVGWQQWKQELTQVQRESGLTLRCVYFTDKRGRPRFVSCCVLFLCLF